MYFDSKGLPTDVGASDYMDSARLAGIMAVFGHPQMTKEKILLYMINESQAVRYPFSDPYNPASNNPNNFTRDQLVCLAAGLKVLGCDEACKQLLKAARERNYRAQNIESDIVGSEDFS